MKSEDATEPLGSYDHNHPVRPDQERVNAITHALATAVWLAVGVWLVMRAMASGTDGRVGLAVACSVYVATVVGTFLCSTLSHVFLTPPWLERFRAWDQAFIYLMIVGTYTPIAWVYALPTHRPWLIGGMWLFALAGFLKKVAWRHRVERINVIGYLALGWIPAIPLIREVPMELAGTMLLGGVLYTVGVVFLMNDHRVRFLHAAWHLFVLSASLVHAVGIAWYVVELA